MTTPAPISPAPTPRPPRQRVAGEPMVWLTATGLGIGILMVVGLLLVILVNGIGAFWPYRFSEVVLADGTRVAGALVKRVDKPERRGKPSVSEVQLFTGNRDVYGQAFRYVRNQDIVSQSAPADLMLVERLEYGVVLGYPVRIELGDGQAISATDAAFAGRLADLIEAVEGRRKELTQVEKHEIGRNSTELSALKQKMEYQGDADPAFTATAQARVLELEAEYVRLKARQDTLNDRQGVEHLVMRLTGGEELSISMGNILDVELPNQRGIFGQTGVFLHNIWAFVSEDPREANTEGGIFPAIMGTFIMTILMSVAVVPVGVLAAIYLREYARQGPFVRAVRIAINNLAGVPSIVFGIFGLGFFIYFVGGSIDALFYPERLPSPTFGTGGLMWASFTLALMTVPVVIVATEEAVAAVPRGMKEGSLALGASKWQTIQRIVLPAAVPGILTGAILAMARGAGEVAPLMLVGVVKVADELPISTTFPFGLNQKFMHLGFHIYDLGFQSPDSEAARPMVFATTLFLILLVLVLNLGAILMRERLRRRFATGAF